MPGARHCAGILADGKQHGKQCSKRPQFGLRTDNVKLFCHGCRPNENYVSLQKKQAPGAFARACCCDKKKTCNNVNKEHAAGADVRIPTGAANKDRALKMLCGRGLCLSPEKIETLATAAEAGKDLRFRIYHLHPGDTYLDAQGERRPYRKGKKGRRQPDYGTPIATADPARLTRDHQPLAADEEWVVPARAPAQVEASPAKTAAARDPAARTGRVRERLFENTGLSAGTAARQAADAAAASAVREANEKATAAEARAEDEKRRRIEAEAEATRLRKAPAVSAQRLHDNQHLQAKLNAHTGVKSYPIWRALVGMMRLYYPAGFRPFDNALVSTDANALNAAIAHNIKTRCPTEPGYQTERQAVQAAVASGVVHSSSPGIPSTETPNRPVGDNPPAAAGAAAAAGGGGAAPPAPVAAGEQARAAAVQALDAAVAAAAMAARAPAAATPARKRAPGGGRKPGSGRKLSMEDGMYLTLRVLKFGCTVEQASADFGVHHNTGGRAFRTTVRAMSEMFKLEMPRPTKAELEETTPAWFKDTLGRDDVQAMADATNVPLPHATNPELARSMWSQYYKMYCAVYQIVISPGGYGMFVNTASSPKLTDAEQVVLSGLLQFLHRGGCMVLDRGYAGLRQHTSGYGLKVAMPAHRIRLKRGQKKEDRVQVGRESCRYSRRVAKVRSHNEREMRRVKEFRFLKQVVPFEYLDILDDIVWICVCLGNLKCPLTQTNAWETETEAEADEVDREAAAAAAARRRV